MTPKQQYLFCLAQGVEDMTLCPVYEPHGIVLYVSQYSWLQSHPHIPPPSLCQLWSRTLSGECFEGLAWELLYIASAFDPRI